MSIIEKLTEGIISRNVQKEGQAVLNKWEKTGLLEGIKTDYGGNRVGAEITGGVNVDPVPGNAALGSNKDQQGFYNLHNGYASPTGSIDRITFAIVASGTFGASYSKKDAVASSAGFQYALPL